MIPSIGEVVLYKLSSTDIETIRARRNRAMGNYSDHLGNPLFEGDDFPAIITRVWDQTPTALSLVQLQVFLDGSDQVWAFSSEQGCENGNWRKRTFAEPDAHRQKAEQI